MLNRVDREILVCEKQSILWLAVSIGIQFYYLQQKNAENYEIVL